MVLARAELDLGDRAAAERLVDERLAADPGDGEASLLKAEALMKRGDADPKTREGLYDQASKVLSEALKRRQDDFRLLYAFARSRSLAAGYPSDNMLFVLQRALELAPQAPAVRLTAAEAYASRGRYAQAIAVLRPLANDPHDPDQGKAAADAIQRYEKNEADAATAGG
jgi:predicted Zn-dependent protease